MSVITQRVYSPQLRPGLIGMIADQVEHSIQTKLCEATTGIGFGLGVCQGSLLDKGAKLGAANFLGITVRDIALSLSPLDPLAPDGTFNPLDAYGYKVNMGVLSRGHIWVAAGADCVAGDPLFFGALGGLTNSASGNAATGYVQFSKNPAPNETLVINGATFTFVASGATGDQVNIGQVLGDTIAAAVAVLNGSGTAGFSALAFRASPPSPGGLPQGSGADTILIAAKAPGVAGNALAITSGPAGMTKSGATLAGGTAAAVAVPSGRWLDSQIAGLPARVALAIQV